MHLPTYMPLASDAYHVGVLPYRCCTLVIGSQIVAMTLLLVIAALLCG